jgi:hypothetical protein
VPIRNSSLSVWRSIIATCFLLACVRFPLTPPAAHQRNTDRQSPARYSCSGPSTGRAVKPRLTSPPPLGPELQLHFEPNQAGGLQHYSSSFFQSNVGDRSPALEPIILAGAPPAKATTRATFWPTLLTMLDRSACTSSSTITALRLAVQTKPTGCGTSSSNSNNYPYPKSSWTNDWVHVIDWVHRIQRTQGAVQNSERRSEPTSLTSSCALRNPMI